MTTPPHLARASIRLRPTLDAVSGCPANIPSFVVQLQYREPTYEMRHGAKEHPYRITYQVAASSEATAIELAVAEFHEVTRASSVCWPRVLVSIVVIPADDDGHDGR